MNKYSARSERKLKTAHPLLQIVFRSVLQDMDHTIVEGRRGKKKQNAYYSSGKSRVKWPKGKHNSKPSKAIDAGPYINGKLSEHVGQCCYFAALVVERARQFGIIIRWGGNWDGDEEIMTDQQFQDLWHFEIIL